MPSKAPDNTLDDVQVLGTWNFTLQGDTPLYWLRTGQLDRYLLKFRVTHQCPCVCGIVLHAEVDGPGTDGASFWIERRPPGKNETEPTKRYVLAGEGLESKPIITRSFPDTGTEAFEDIEVLMEGLEGSILLQNRKVQLRFRTKHAKGSIAFYNSTQGDNDDIHFGGIRITALRRGPLEVDGNLLKRERELERMHSEGRIYTPAPAEAPPAPKPPPNDYTSRLLRASQSTMAPDSWAPRTGGSTMSFATTSLRSPQLSRTAHTSGGASTTLRSPAGGKLPMALAGSSTTSGKGRLQMSFSEGSLQKSGGLMAGAGAKGSTTFGGMWGPPSRPPRQKWVALALNAPAGEQELLKGVSRRPPKEKDCTDFIPM